MKKTQCIMASAVLVLAGRAAFAGLAIFSPASQDVQVNSGEVVTMQIRLRTEQLSNFVSADVIIEGDTGFYFSYSLEWESPIITNRIQFPGDFGPPPPWTALYVGGGSAGPIPENIWLGTISVDTSALGLGTYAIWIDSERDGGISNLSNFQGSEPLHGQGVINVVPEPGMVALVLIGSGVMLKSAPSLSRLGKQHK